MQPNMKASRVADAQYRLRASPPEACGLSRKSPTTAPNGRVKMKALAGHEVYSLTPEQLAQWKSAVKPLHDSWAEAVKKAGGDPEKIDADLQAALKKHDAGM